MQCITNLNKCTKKSNDVLRNLLNNLNKCSKYQITITNIVPPIRAPPNPGAAPRGEGGVCPATRQVAGGVSGEYTPFY